MSEVSFSVNAFIREEFEKNALPSLMGKNKITKQFLSLVYLT